MKIAKLQLENFRNSERYLFEFDLNKPITLFVGANGRGKTNLLEAIYLLSIGRSFRTTEGTDLIRWEQDFARVRGDILVSPSTAGDSGTRPATAASHIASSAAASEVSHLEVFHSIRPAVRKNFRKNEVSLRQSNYIGNFLTVLFHPEDLNMLYLSPSLRRRYLDIVLSQTDRHYLSALSRYKKVISQRNALLKQIRQKSGGFPSSYSTAQSNSPLLEDLDAWDQEAIKYGSQIVLSRLKFVEFLNENVERFYNSIADQKSEVRLKYSTKLGSSPTLEEIASQYFEALFSRRQVDIIRAETTVGPHRDDLSFSLNNHDILSSASRGEFRTLLLAIKLAEIEFIKSVTGHSPVLLLDDVFSELDDKRQFHLIEALQGSQAIITTTELHGLDELLGECQVVEV